MSETRVKREESKGVLESAPRPSDAPRPPAAGTGGPRMPAWLAVALTVVYPAVVFFGRGHVSPHILALVLAAVVLVRRRGAFGIRVSPWVVVGGMLLALLAFGLNDALPLKLYPVLVNASLLAIFLLSFWIPPPIVERIARSQVPDLSQPAVVYTAKVTRAWCVFFGGNALVALWTAVWCSDRVWFYYNGIIAYALAGLMFAGEWLVRRLVLRGNYR
jgi:uncharacterized membrane protein